MQVKPVKLVAALLFSEPEALAAGTAALTTRFSALDYRGAAVPFTLSRYYEPEMGAGLQRIMVGFETLIDPFYLREIKHACAALERELSGPSGRRVNIDPGYLDLFKLVLASFKGRGNKIYLGEGVWADMTAYFEKGRFCTFPWSFPDIKQGFFDQDLRAIREIYKNQLTGLTTGTA